MRRSLKVGGLRFWKWMPLVLSLISVGAQPSQSQETVSMSLPPFVSFNVANVSQFSTASPSTVMFDFSNAQLNPGMSLSVSLIADNTTFNAPSGNAIPVSKVTWTTSGASGGTGYSGTLSGSAYTEVFRSFANPTSGSVDIGFRLDATGSAIRAGDHNLTLRWKFESVP